MSLNVEKEDTSPIMKGSEADKAADFANYFCSYAYLYHQKQMLMDHVRMRAYHSAVMANKSLFEGKVVLDIGTGSGVLAIWSAQAGAAKVYAVEFTDMANHARNLVNKNGLAEIVEVIQSSVEELELPCKVDIIISEWMGYFLLRESMLDSVIRARDKWLKPDGCMFPSHATMLWGAVSFEDDRESKVSEYLASMGDWRKFSSEMQDMYNVDMSALTDPYETEQSQYYIFSSLWTELQVEHIIGQPVVVKRLDLKSCSLADSEGIMNAPFDIEVPFYSIISGFAGWFTVDFNGSVETPAVRRVQLSTGPEMGYTHWGQQVFYLRNPIDSPSGSKIAGNISMVRQAKNKRLYDLHIELKNENESVVALKYEIP